VDLVQLFAPSISRSVIETEMAKALDFEYRLANVSIKVMREFANDVLEFLI
jgi:hypothetical protein